MPISFYGLFLIRNLLEKKVLCTHPITPDEPTNRLYKPLIDKNAIFVDYFKPAR